VKTSSTALTVKKCELCEDKYVLPVTAVRQNCSGPRFL